MVMISEAVSLAPYPSVTVMVAVMVEPTGRPLSMVSVELVPRMVPMSSIHVKSAVRDSASMSEVLWIISSVTFASTVLEGEILKLSMFGAVFSIAIVLDVSIAAPSVSTVDAVQTIVSVGLFSAGFMV